MIAQGELSTCAASSCSIVRGNRASSVMVIGSGTLTHAVRCQAASGRTSRRIIAYDMVHARTAPA